MNTKKKKKTVVKFKNLKTNYIQLRCKLRYNRSQRSRSPNASLYLKTNLILKNDHFILNKEEIYLQL